MSAGFQVYLPNYVLNIGTAELILNNPEHMHHSYVDLYVQHVFLLCIIRCLSILQSLPQ